MFDASKHCRTWVERHYYEEEDQDRVCNAILEAIANEPELANRSYGEIARMLEVEG